MTRAAMAMVRVFTGSSWRLRAKIGDHRPAPPRAPRNRSGTMAVMTRVIAGSARGRRLAVPAGDGHPARPPTGPARACSPACCRCVDLEQARVLDLYAGSGALGLEALSRGAAQRHARRERPGRGGRPARQRRRPRPARRARRRRRRSSGGSPSIPSRATTSRWSTRRTSSTSSRSSTAARAVAGRRRGRRGRARDPRAELAWPDGFEPLRERRYGEATLWYARRAPLGRDHETGRLSRFLRPRDPRSPRHRRAGLGHLRRGHRRRPGEQEEVVAVHASTSAWTCSREVTAVLRQRQGRQLPRPARRLLPRRSRSRSSSRACAPSATSTTSCRWRR